MADPTEPAFTPLDDVGFIPLELIDAGDRLRPVDASWAEALGQIMLKDGQRTPIEVCRLPGQARWTLVTGAHRLAGAALAGIPEIMAIVVGANALDRRLSEVSENLFRRELGPVDRSNFLAELHEIMKARAGVDGGSSAQQAAINRRWKKELKNEAGDTIPKIGIVYQLQGELLASIGFKQSSFYNSLLIHRRIAPSLLAQLSGHAILAIGSDLLKLAKLDSERQREVVDLLVAGEKRVGSALAILDQKPRVSPEERKQQAFLSAFDRMGVVDRRTVLRRLIDKMSPSMRQMFVDIFDEARA